jgi:hypothetical protein
MLHLSLETIKPVHKIINEVLILCYDLFSQVELSIAIAGTFALPEISLVYRVLGTFNF